MLEIVAMTGVTKNGKEDTVQYSLQINTFALDTSHLHVKDTELLCFLRRLGLPLLLEPFVSALEHYVT
ncbi:unnamed protein product [Peronospora belbahrii]|uniref:Uncharacterized protein n=1 Tax=Peronospora belbahrii TaxID=622444 RepID=A0ABN8CWB6_9STRA|nr:unnamed protein product [Peronospora belbahrii]